MQGSTVRNRAEEVYKLYYVRITDNTGHSPRLATSTLKSIARKLKAKYLGVKSLGHGTKSFSKPHVHAVLLTKESADLKALKKLIPPGFHFKLWRIKTLSDLAESRQYIKEHIEKPEKRGFFWEAEALSGRILKMQCLAGLRAGRLAHAPPISWRRRLLENLREVVA
ncbi:hypothetical protein [Geoglobus sp.]